MEQSPSWEAHRTSFSQDIPRILWKPKIHYSIHNSPPPVPILSQLDPVHFPHPTYWRFISVLSYLRLGLTTGFFSLRFPHQKPLYTTPLFHTYYTPHPSQCLRLHHSNTIWWLQEIIKLLIVQSSPLSCYLVPLWSKIPPQDPIFKHPQPTLLPHCEKPSFRPSENKWRNCSSANLNTLRTRSFKLFKHPFPGFLTILTL